MKKVISTILIILGILIMFYPKIDEKYNTMKQAKLLQEWEEELNEDVEKVEKIIENSNDESKEEKVILEKEYGSLEGVLKIDKINLELPILSGATHENMKTSVASINKLYFPGDEGNYSIAGHRNLTYGRNFNRLDEIVQGDILEIDTKEKIYRYKVDEKLYVLPEDTWVLDNDGSKKITLVTCHPTGVSSHRLIISGTLIEE